MLRFTQSKNSDAAKQYFDQALQTSDYFISDVELQGQFHGELAAQLGIQGVTTKEAFHSLCDNLIPLSGEMLTQRTRQDRTVGYDLTFSVPKSVSIINALHENSGIQEAFSQSVNETMKLVEADIMTRVRVDSKDENRKGHGMIWAEFIHTTARSIDKNTAPDPFLHCHAFLFNATMDVVEGKIKAAQFQFAKRDAPYYQAIFYKKMADRLVELGYSVHKSGKSFELDGVPESIRSLFSKRTRQIENFALEHGITGEKALSELGSKTRTAKQKGLSMAELKADWRNQIRENISKEDAESTATIRYAPVKVPVKTSVKECLLHSYTHSFERASVMPARRILAQAYMHSLGNKSVDIADIDTAFRNDKTIINVRDDDQVVCTTIDVLKEEQHMVNLARSGMNTVRPMYSTMPETHLEGQHYVAAEHILTTPDRTTICMGAAGSGKTFLATELVRLIENTGINVTVVAPSAAASRGVLRAEGFEKADTVAKLLTDKKMQEALRNNALYIDEAGLLDNHSMISVLELTKKYNARLILAGDTRQHSAVLRSQALLTLHKVAGIKAAEVNKIYRQRDQYYRQAIQEFAKGNVKGALDKLETINAIKEVDPKNPNEQLIADYVDTIKNKSALIVSPTHEQIRHVTEGVRQKMRETGLIGNKEIAARKLKNLNLTEAERGDWRNLQKDQIIQFNQNLTQIKRGSLWAVSQVENGKITIADKEGKKLILPLEKAKDYSIYKELEIGLSKGDKIRITQNCFDQQGKRLDNGQALQVKRINKSGKVVFVSEKSKTEYVFDKDFGHLDHNYCITSNASQGQTVDEVFVSMPANTLVAASQQQFYVSCSRGRDAVRIYTDDKPELLRSVQLDRSKQSAIELVQKANYLNTILELEKAPAKQPTKTYSQQKSKQVNYEPEL